MREPDPDAMLERMRSTTMAEWQAYYRLEPWGFWPDWARAGTVAAMVANSRRTKRSDRVFKPEDFMPEPPEKTMPKKQTLAEQKAALAAWIRALEAGGVKVKRRRRGNPA